MRHPVQVEVIQELISQLDAGVNFDAGGLRLSPADVYTSREHMAHERQVLFRDYPQVVGMSGDLPGPGTFLTNNDLGVPVLLTRGADGKVRAFLNSCRHRGPVIEHEKRGKRSRFSCRFHAWTYNNSGALIGVPMEDHFGDIDKACLGLIELPAAERYGFLVVHLDPDGVIDTDAVFEGLADDFESWGWDRYVLGTEQTVDMKMNWKLATDTFGETYHFKRLHKDTLAGNFHGDVLSYRSYARNHRMVLCKKGIDEMRGQPASGWNVVAGGFPVYFLFPNIVINVSERGIAVVRAYPDAEDPGRSISQIGYYFEPSDLAANPEAPAEFAAVFGRVVMEEDYALAVSTQTALNAGLQKTVILGRNEAPLHHYHNTFRKALGDGTPAPAAEPALSSGAQSRDRLVGQFKAAINALKQTRQIDSLGALLALHVTGIYPVYDAG